MCCGSFVPWSGGLHKLVCLPSKHAHKQWCCAALLIHQSLKMLCMMPQQGRLSSGGFGSGLLLTSSNYRVTFPPTPQSSIFVACLCLGACAISVHAMERQLELCMLWQARPTKIDNGWSDGIVTSDLLKPGGRD